MKTLLINSAKISADSISVHTRTALFLSERYGIELVSTAEEINCLDPRNYKKVVVFGSAFYPKTAEIEAWIRRIKEPTIIWINNEYTCSPNSEYARLIKDFDSIVISNHVESGNKVKGYNRFYFLNLNAICARKANDTIFKKYDLCYYGAYRPGRRLYLQKYFQHGDFHLSSSKKNLRKFEQLAGCKAIFCNSFKWHEGREAFNLFRNTIYLEDEKTHEIYSHLGNRYYEAMFCNVAQYFDVSCRNTVEKSKIAFDESFYVSNYEELKSRIQSNDAVKTAAIQRDLWQQQAIAERDAVIAAIADIVLG
jgi:hypothetical protein